MSSSTARTAFKSLSTSLQSSSTGKIRRATRAALQSHNGLRHPRPRNFSSTSIAQRPAPVNLARPTTRTATTSTASTTSAPKPASTPPAAAKPAVPVRTTSTPQKPAPASHITNPTTVRNLSSGLSDSLPEAPDTPTPTAAPVDSTGSQVDWSRSFHGLSATPFSKEASEALMAPITPEDVEIKPDGIIYLPEIKYRRILNKAFGPGGWGLAPRGETIVTPKSVTREYGLVVHGRLISIARGEQQYFDPEGIPTATEGCKSNALMRCCKDLGIASELWDPVFIRKFMASHSKEVWVEHATTKKKRKIIMRKDVNSVPYPYKEVK